MKPAQLIESLAGQILSNDIAPSQLPQLIQDAGLARVPVAIWTEIDARLARSPLSAHALALVVKEIAAQSGSSRRRAIANLTWIRTLNTIGSFRESLGAIPETTQSFLDSRDRVGAARTWLEAASAESYLGNLESARDHLARARTLLPARADRATRARADWIEGRILRDQGDYGQAARLFDGALKGLKACGRELDAARCRREIGHALIHSNAGEALEVLEGARRFFRQASCPVEVALTDNLLAQAYLQLNRFKDALDCLEQARPVLGEQGMSFFVAACDLDAGFVEWRRNRFEQALIYLNRARECFDEYGAEAEASSCQINIGCVLLELNRYEDAIQRLIPAAQAALGSGRRKKAALCFVNIGWALDKQGRYAQALHYYRLARDEFTRGELRYETALYADVNMARVYLNLGRNLAALELLDRARAVLKGPDLVADLAECEFYRARALLGLGREAEAFEALRQARALFLATEQEVYAAHCGRILAGASEGLKPRAEARALLKSGRAVFAKHGQLIDLALCDLTEGELHLAWHEWKAAKKDLEHAKGILAPAFPDHAWSAEYGLGKVALANKGSKAALPHYLAAVRTIGQVRAGLGLEQLSNDLVGARQHVYADALELALVSGSRQDTLNVIEAAKAQIFLGQLVKQDWRPDPTSLLGEDSSGLYRRERDLRFRLAALRRNVSTQISQAEGLSHRGSAGLEPISPQQVEQVEQLRQEYEQVALELRTAKRGLRGAPSLAPFSLGAFREMAVTRWGHAWSALDYYLVNDQLIVVYLDADSLDAEVMDLSRHDRFVLEQCASTHPELRERIYRGTVDGAPVPTSGQEYLRYLGSRLVPERVHHLSGERTLIVSLHGVLHQLPFHVLMHDGRFLIEQFQVIYTPSLQALTQLHQDSPSEMKHPRALLCGLGEFDARAQPLPHIASELRSVQATLDKTPTTLWQQGATRRQILEWNAKGELTQFDVLHFATHAIMEPAAPHWSRILLADEDLTVLDIMDLALDARLVTLSACVSALGRGGQGDEIVGLARAFFYAGARALAASLWLVEDESTSQLMGRFYRNLSKGATIGRSLREAQLDMAQAGARPFQWAPFVTIGDA